MALSDALQLIPDGQPEGQPPQVMMEPRITRDSIVKIKQVLYDYQAGKKVLERRIREDEQWWRQRHWEVEEQNGEPTGNPEDLRPKSAWLFHTIMGKHADMVEAYPEPVILPRELMDKAEAQRLTDILPVILAHNDFDDVYSDCAWTKNISGTAIYGVFWDKSKLNGMGDITITEISALNLFWQPGVKDIQKSPNVFLAEQVDIERLELEYPMLKGQLKGSDAITLTKYQADDHQRDDKKAVVIDWYYKKYQQGRTVLHYCKFVGSEILYATENTPDLAERGLYDDGLYPFIVDPLFPIRNSPAGFGYVEIGKSPQMSIDLVNQQLLKSAIANATPRWFISDAAKVNEKEYMDTRKPLVKVTGMIDDSLLRQIEVNPPSPAAIEMRSQMIEEMKYTSGNLDVVNGGATGGVTAYRAISALIDSAGRSSKDGIRGTYRAFNRLITMVIERIRQFYDMPRQFRITGANGQEQFISYSAQGIQPQPLGMAFGQDLGMRLPVFDVEVRAQKQTEYNKLAQNELAKELYQLGVFNPAMADQADLLMEMMDFKGKEEIKQRIQQNSMLYQLMAMMQAQKQAEKQTQQGGAQAAVSGKETPPPAALNPMQDNLGAQAMMQVQQARMPG